MHVIKIGVTKHQYAKCNKLIYMYVKLFSKSTSQIVLYAGHLKKIMIGVLNFAVTFSASWIVRQIMIKQVLIKITRAIS